MTVDIFRMVMVSALLAAWVGVPGAARAADRALLVGLDVYGHPEVSDTPGGAEDARSMAQTVQEVFGFPAEGIRLLVNEEATSTAVVREFEDWLIRGTGPGDRVFFLYAGHGSQLPDQNGDEEDGYDETLAPFDVDPETGAHQIRDDEIDGLISRLSGRRAVLLFDSCHSGTLTRSGGSATAGGGVRYLPRPDQRAQMPRLRGSGGLRVEPSPNTESHVFDDPEAISRMTGIVAISAAGPGQLAYPIQVEGAERGALSYLFQQAVSSRGSRGLLENLGEKVLESAKDAAEKAAHDAVEEAIDGDLDKKWVESTVDDVKAEVTVAVLETLIEKGMEKLQKSGELEGDQKPWFEVLSEKPIEEEPLFGDWQQAAMAAMANPIDDRSVTLRTRRDQALFYRGESLVLEVGTDRPGYLYLLVFSEKERATCIFPNPMDREHRIPKGSLTVPTHAGYKLPVQEPFGRDVIVALVSDEPLALCDRTDYQWHEIFARVHLEEIQERLGDRVRRGVGVQKVSSSGSEASWQTATLVVHTVDRERGAP